MSGSWGALLRTWGLALVALFVWHVTEHFYYPHNWQSATASPDVFSAARAESTLATILGPERPHPVGSAENAAVHARILEQFAKLGVPAKTYRAFTCNSAGRRFAYVACATTTDIVADAIPGEGKAIVLLAHYDSVPAGPGASDDGSGVATVIETVRALKAGGAKSLHPVMAVITDGEEGGLLGANAFLENPALKARVGAVINVEARGTKGPSLLFQTSPGDARLIDLYAKSVPIVATSSLYAEIYKFLPNDTDLTLFIRAGFPSFNFAFADNVRYYHSPFDIRANLDRATLQMHGDNMLGVARALEHTDFAAIKGGDAVYLSLFGAALPRLPASWALPLAIVVFLALALAAWMARAGQGADWRGVTSAAFMPLLLLIGSCLFGWLLALIAQTVSGRPDPTYAYPTAMRWGLGFAVWAITLLVSRMVTNGRLAVAAAWLWLAALGVVTAALLPGLSPYFVFPGVVAAVLLLATARSGWDSGLGQAALFVSALASFVIWIGLVVSGETLMGLRLHPLFTIPLAFALLTAVPLLATRPMSHAAWNASVVISGAAALLIAVIAGLQPAYSKKSPQRVNIIYLENGSSPARFIADTSWKGVGLEPIPLQLMKAGPFTLDQNAWGGLRIQYSGASGYVAPAGSAIYSVPKATIVHDAEEGGVRHVELAFEGSSAANGIVMSIPKAAKLVSLDLRSEQISVAGWTTDARVICWTPDCRDLHVKLALAATGAVAINFAEFRYGLPPSGARLQAARPQEAMPSQSGDETILANEVVLPAR
ncbi:MAG TPA: M20/M25/M40 family metallo-hydrolase [Rhizomicrobium sp.]|nr:M20/M25/M40 family metallo-hydrolase [Rhizomicrobium sp.]